MWIIGIPGVLIATAVAVFIAEYIMKGIILYKTVFKIDPKKYYIINIKFFVIMLMDLLVAYVILNSINIVTMGKWFAVYIIFTIINGLVMLLVYYILKEVKFLHRIKMIFGGGRQ